MIAEILCVALVAYYVILFLRIILSFTTQFWSPPPYLGAAVRVIYDVTEPVLGPLQRIIPPVGGFDFSPLIVFFAISIARGALGC